MKTPEMYLKDTNEALRGASFENDELGVTQAIMYMKHRDSDNMNLSNFDYMVKQLTSLIGSEDESTWHIEEFSHWAVGYVTYIIVTVYDDSHETTPAFNLMNDLYAALENYPALDDEDYFEREYNDMIEYLKDEIKYLENRVEFVNPQKLDYTEIAHQVSRRLDSFALGDVTDAQIETALFDLGYTDYPVYIVGIGSPGCIYDSVSYFEDENSAREYMEDQVVELRDDGGIVNRLLDLHIINSYLYVELSESTLSNLNAKSFNELND